MAEHDFETLASETVYVGKIFALRADEVLMPGGNAARREVVEHYGAVAILALDDDGNVVLVYQYRHPLGRRLWELPAGLLDLGGEAPHLTAARELEEEAGLAAAEGLTDLDVARAVKPPTPSRRLPKSLSIDEVLALLDGAGGDTESDGPLTLRNRAMLEVLYSTGARISEAVGLDIDDVDTHARSVLLRGKGGKQRLVPIGRPAVSALDAYLVRGRPDLARRGRGTPAIFLNARGGRLSRQSAWQVLQDAAERAGISSAVSPHTLRHSFATHLLDGGADVRVVQELLGHASVTTTQIYTMVTVHALREVWAGAHPRAR